ncbi:hypothetical protein [Thermoactinomyces sp. DSM 45892]|uniref:hypothetical protein n=1 Tax=Thermoactinomyces sp. DSM 45892 TaxID=1882753 RepID=UPI0008951E71|nr:hypothetical protein [Thermoactinomyces sp. DSM 45892]SDY83392.1 hypothetical protein SAMN05444416_10925 [Thermoactinomyces sp. DSM 45892]
MKICEECQTNRATHSREVSESGLRRKSLVCWSCLKPYHDYTDQTIIRLADAKKVNPATCDLCGFSPSNYLWDEKLREDGETNFHCKNCGDLIGSSGDEWRK